MNRCGHSFIGPTARSGIFSLGLYRIPFDKFLPEALRKPRGPGVVVIVCCCFVFLWSLLLVFDRNKFVAGDAPASAVFAKDGCAALYLLCIQ